HLRKFLEQPRHVQVVLRRVKPHPREHELARLRMPVVRLVHVPDDRDGQLPVHALAPLLRQPCGGLAPRSTLAPLAEQGPLPLTARRSTSLMRAPPHPMPRRGGGG